MSVSDVIQTEGVDIKENWTLWHSIQHAIQNVPRLSTLKHRWMQIPGESGIRD